MRNIEKDSVCKTYKLVDQSAYSQDLIFEFPYVCGCSEEAMFKNFLELSYASLLYSF